MIMPLVSIGIPTYNRSQGVRRTLACLCSQTYKNLEIIVSDNCSPDPSVDTIVREFAEKDSRIKYYRQEENKGMVFNFQFVLKKATGDYFMWLADDDWLEESVYIERCAVFLKDHSAYVMATGKTKFCDKDMSFSYSPEIIDLSYDDRFERIKNYFSKINSESLCYSLIRLKEFKQVKHSAGLAGDWVMVAQLLYFGKAATIKSINIWRTNEGASKNTENYLKFVNRPNTNIFNYWPYLVSNVLNTLKEFEAAASGIVPLSKQEFADIKRVMNRKGILYRRVITRLSRFLRIIMTKWGLVR